MVQYTANTGAQFQHIAVEITMRAVNGHSVANLMHTRFAHGSEPSRSESPAQSVYFASTALRTPFPLRAVRCPFRYYLYFGRP